MLSFIRSIIYLLQLFNALVFTRQTCDKVWNCQYPSVKSDSVMTQAKKLPLKTLLIYYWEQFLQHWEISHQPLWGKNVRKIQRLQSQSLEVTEGETLGWREWMNPALLCCSDALSEALNPAASAEKPSGPQQRSLGGSKCWMHVSVYDPEESSCSWLAQHSYQASAKVQTEAFQFVASSFFTRKTSVIVNRCRKCIEQRFNRPWPDLF